MSQFFQDPGVHLIRSHGLTYIQVRQRVSSLIISYNGCDFIPPFSALRFRDLRDVGQKIASEKGGKKVVGYLSLLHVICHQVLCLIRWAMKILIHLNKAN